MRIRGRQLATLVVAATAFVAVAGYAGYQVFVFLTDRPTKLAVQVPTRYKDVRDSAGHKAHVKQGSDVLCQDCHSMGGPEMVGPGVKPCEGCHDNATTALHGTSVARASIDCLSCHDFGGDPQIQPWNCVRCHAEPNTPKEDLPVHFDQKCGECHQPHAEPALQPRGCIDCHEDNPVRHTTKKVAGAQECLDCHESHDEAVAPSRRCAACHSASGSGRPIIDAKLALSDKAHEECVTCHADHNFDKKSAKTCTSCHEHQHVLAQKLVRQHASCQTCHPPHDTGHALKKCASCHAKDTTAHPVMKQGESKLDTCQGCHPMHPKDASMVAKAAVACSSCHKEAANDQAFHAQGAKGQTCVSCHAPHGKGAIKLAGTASCKSCHAPEVLATTRGKGHADCLQCHTKAAHEPKLPRPTCGSCHKEELATATKGHADKCVECHDVHAANVKPEANCRTCHAAQVKGPHVAIKNGCNACHRPHGPKGVAAPPKCVDCHGPEGRLGLHTSKGHDKCVDCHAAHMPTPMKDRASCLRCHKDMTNHEPQATVCSGCHPFAD